MSRYRVVVTSRSFGSVSSKAPKILETADCEVIRLSGPLSEDELARALVDADAAIIGTDIVGENVLDNGHNLKVISKHGAGVDNIDIAAASARGIAVTNCPNSNSEAVADLAFGLMLAAARQIVPADRSVRAGEWKRFYGSGVHGKTLGIIGLGAIGRAVARRAKGFSMEVLAFDVALSPEAARDLGVTLTDIDTIMKNADYVSVHVPLTPQTRGLIDLKRLKLMKPSGYLINTARGGVVTESDLVTALEQRIIAGAAVDVYEAEPPASDHPLFNLDSVVVTPHIAAYTDDAIDAMSIQSAQNAVEVLTKGQCKYIVNAKDLKGPYAK